MLAVAPFNNLVMNLYFVQKIPLFLSLAIFCYISSLISKVYEISKNNADYVHGNMIILYPINFLGVQCKLFTLHDKEFEEKQFTLF